LVEAESTSNLAGRDARKPGAAGSRASIPGLRYQLTLEDANGVNTLQGPKIGPLGPGERRDLGDVTAIGLGEAD
jgi:hypothetical protein